MRLLLAALAAAAAAGEPRPAVMPVRSLRGGQLAQPASAESPAAPLTASPPAAELDGGAALQVYLEAMGGFMERFSQLVDTAIGTCKPNFFGMPPPSAAKIRSRPDRQALTVTLTLTLSLTLTLRLRLSLSLSLGLGLSLCLSLSLGLSPGLSLSLSLSLTGAAASAPPPARLAHRRTRDGGRRHACGVRGRLDEPASAAGVAARRGGAGPRQPPRCAGG